GVEWCCGHRGAWAMSMACSLPVAPSKVPSQLLEQPPGTENFRLAAARWASPAIKACLVRMLLLLLKFLLSRNYCLIPAPVDVPVIFWALTISAPSLEVIQRASSALLVVTCSVRR